MPRSVDGDSGDAAFSTRRGKSPLYISNLCQPALAALIIIVLPWYFVLSDQRANFSVQLQLLQPTTTTTGHITTSFFNGTLHAGNGRGTERCYGHGDVAVTYGGFTVASGRVPGFCVPGNKRREVPFQLAPTDVGLPENLRDRAADETAMVGALELEVQIELFNDRGGGGTTPSRRMWCTARVGSTGQPPEVAMCIVFAVQNWFDFGA